MKKAPGKRFIFAVGAQRQKQSRSICLPGTTFIAQR
jgi:hypothetical protein